jgi:hypothetical protein
MFEALFGLKARVGVPRLIVDLLSLTLDRFPVTLFNLTLIHAAHCGSRLCWVLIVIVEVEGWRGAQGFEPEEWRC